MKIRMLKNAFKPNDTAKARTILTKGSLVELPDGDAKVLVDKKYAVKHDPKGEKEPKAPKDEKKSDKGEKEPTADSPAAK